MRKIIITAANSFIGYRLSLKMANEGYFVYAVTRRADDKINLLSNNSNIKVIYETMDNYLNLDKDILDKCNVAVALAWNGTRGEDRADVLKQQQNYRYSLDCINSFIKLGCKKILTAGSQAEYGPWTSKEKVKEVDVCNPNTEYGRYKLKLYMDACKICEEHDVKLIEPRFFSLYGPDDYKGTMIISILTNMLKNEPCELTKCIQLWDFLYIDDAIDALYKLIDSNNTNGIYNFGSGTSKELKEYVNTMYKLINSNSELLFGNVPYPKTGIVNTNPCIDKLLNDIDWKPKTSFEEGINIIINDLMSK